MVNKCQIQTKSGMFEVDFDKYFNDGEILKPEFDEIKHVLDRAIENEVDEIHKRNRPINDRYNDIYYFHPTILTFATLKKKLQPFVQSDNQFVKDMSSLYEKYASISENVKKLKGIVKTTTKKREEVKERKREEFALKCQIDPLTKALITYHENFVEAAKEDAGKTYDERKQYLHDQGGLEAVAPEPSIEMSREAYMQAKEEREFFKQFVVLTRERYVENAGKAAHDDYMAWVNKMAAKIGKKVVEASMKIESWKKTIRNPWMESTLVVTTEDGETQKWHTQMIINHSKYGKPFNQFPSRRFE